MAVGCMRRDVLLSPSPTSKSCIWSVAVVDMSACSSAEGGFEDAAASVVGSAAGVYNDGMEAGADEAMLGQSRSGLQGRHPYVIPAMQGEATHAIVRLLVCCARRGRRRISRAI